MNRVVAGTLVALAAVTALLTASTGFAAQGSRPASSSSGFLRGVDVSERVIAITVDDGPTRAYTPEVLAILRRHRATATFFVLGQSVERDPDLVRAELAQGCEVGSHTWSHARMDRIGDAQARAEVVRGAKALEAVTARPPRYFRPPRGFLSPAILEAARSEGMRAVMWDACLDHVGDKTSRDAASRVLSQIGPGDVVLVHDGAGDRARSVAALDLLLTELEARGYRFVTLSELYRLGGT